MDHHQRGRRQSHRRCRRLGAAGAPSGAAAARGRRASPGPGRYARPMLRSVILAAARSTRVERLVETAPFSRTWCAGSSPVRTPTTRCEPPAELVGRRPRGDPGLSRRGHRARRAGLATRDEYLRLLGAARRRRADARRRGQREALRARPALRREAGLRARAGDLRRGRGGRHHGHRWTWRTHDHRLDAGDAAPAARRLPDHRRGAAGLPAPHRGRLPRAGGGRLAGTAVQGRLRRARVGGVHQRRRCGQVVRAVPEHPDVRPGLPDARHPRPAAGGDRRGPGEVVRQAGRASSSSSCSTASARRSSCGCPARATRCGSTCPTATSGTAT